MITDTQILSYYYKGAEPLPSDPIIISSITAAEFLLIQSQDPTKANYYPILPSRFRHAGAGTGSVDASTPTMRFDSRKHAAFGKHRTDQIILNFNNRFESVIEFGSMAISEIINLRHGGVFASSISHLDKGVQKKLKNRFRFLVETNVNCLAITPKIAEVGLNILGQFLDKYEAKQNLRNTINDVLILSTAAELSLPLLTKDNLLKRFAADILGAECTQGDASNLLIDFTVPAVVDRRRPFESKGYINRGWQVMERRGNR